MNKHRITFDGIWPFSKILAIVIASIIVSGVFVASANELHANLSDCPKDDNPIDIRVAIYTDEKETDEEFYSPYRRTCYFIYALRDYSWKVGDTTYRFVVDLLPTKSLYKGKLTVDNYDVLLYPPDTPDEKISTSFFRFQPRNIIETTRIKKFINEGGGFFGTCAGSMVAGGMENKPNTLNERVIHNLNLGISAVNVEYEEAMPLLCQLRGLEADAVGPAGAYLWYSGWNQTNYSINYHTGVCLDVPIFIDNPIFDDYLEDSRRIRWIGGPSLIVPENPDRNITVLARFPEMEISDNESTDIHYWKYTGGLRGLISGMFRRGELHYFQNLGPFLNAYCFSSDWELLEDKPVKTNFSNKPFMTAEVYPNENHGRIVRCTGHPEHNVWWGGHIEEAEDNDCNNQYEAFYRWKEVKPEEKTVEDEFSYNHWIIRRSVAWASQKVPEDDLPPIYGPSEVRDIYPYTQNPKFTIIGDTEISDGIVSLELYYRFSDDNSSWNNWTYYNTDSDGSDGWSWEFDAPNGTGHYQFYSIRCMRDNIWANETAPFGPDAIANVI